MNTESNFMVADSSTLITWLADHANLVGWPVVCSFVWKFKGGFDKYLNAIEEVKTQTAETNKATAEVKQTVDTIQNNHLAHLASDIKDVASQYDKHTELLASIDKGISVLVDRSARKK